MKRFLILLITLGLVFSSMALSSCNRNSEKFFETKELTNPAKEEMEEQVTELYTDTQEMSLPLHESPIEDFEYQINANDNTVFITKYLGTDKNVVIPSEIEKLPVTVLKPVEDISNNVIEGVFENCQIKSVVIPKSVKFIGDETFKDCNMLTDVIVQSASDLQNIGYMAFMNCISIEKLVFSSTKLLNIRGGAFQGCTKLKEIDLPDGLLTIGKYAFYQCTALLEIRLPKDLEQIDELAFGYCTALEKIEVPVKLNLMVSDQARFYACSSLEQIIFEEGREEIDGYAFFDTITKVEIVIPKSVKKFSFSPFFVHGQAKFVFLGDCPEFIDKTNFYGEPIIYYNPNMMGWKDFPLKDQCQCFPNE